MSTLPINGLEKLQPESRVQSLERNARGLGRVLPYATALLVLGCSVTHAGTDDYRKCFLSRVGTNNSGAVCSSFFWGGEQVQPLVDTNNTAPRFTKSKLSELTLKHEIAVAGVSLGMSMDQVVAVWGKPRGVSLYNRGAPRLSYRDSTDPAHEYATADVFFHPDSNAVMAVWVVFWREHGKPFLSPKVDECLRVLGEPVARNYIPNPLEPQKQPPKHWYCRMVYKKPPLVLYFADGQLMGFEVNPRAKGVAPEGEGSDDYSIQFCLE